VPAYLVLGPVTGTFDLSGWQNAKLVGESDAGSTASRARATADGDGQTDEDLIVRRAVRRA
jgi:hypothetical protein